MSDQQIKEILKRLDQQDADTKAIYLRQSERLDEISAKVDPMYNLFTNATGFNNISVWIMKMMAAVGVAIGVLYAAIKWLRQ